MQREFMEDEVHKTTVLSKYFKALKSLRFNGKVFAPSFAPLDGVGAAIPTQLFVLTVRKSSAPATLPSASQTRKAYGVGQLFKTLG